MYRTSADVSEKPGEQKTTLRSGITVIFKYISLPCSSQHVVESTTFLAEKKKTAANGCQDNHSHPFGAEIKNKWNFTSTQCVLNPLAT
jgi:hypothetical protein